MAVGKCEFVRKVPEYIPVSEKVDAILEGGVVKEKDGKVYWSVCVFCFCNSTCRSS